MSLKKASSSLVSRSRVGFTPTGGGAAVTISNVIVTDSSWNNLDDTAVGTSSSYIKIIGSGFAVNPSVYIGTTQVSSGSITFVSSTELRVVLPSLSLGTQNLFVFNTDYSGAIWSAGLVVSGFPDYTQTTYTSSTPLSVSVQLLATGDAPLTYALQGGSSLPAGTTLSSSGLITGTTTDGTYQFTVIVSDAQNQSFQQQLTLTITSTDQYFNRTVLAINADANTFVTDASSNSFAITINGDTKPSAFSPYNTNWSIYQPAVDANYLNFGTGDWTFSGDFTIDGWVYYTSASSGDTSFYVSNVGSTYLAFNISMSAGVFNIYLNSTSPTSSITHGIVANRWTHVAMVRSGSTITLYTDGVAKGTISSSATIGYNNPTLNRCGGGAAGVQRYISNLRILRGTAINFSTAGVPTSPVSVSTANQILLTAYGNRFADFNATVSAKTITLNGSPTITSFGPFTEIDTTTGSTYFDGTGDYLSVPSNAAFDLASGNFTIECWAYPTTWNATAVGIFGKRSSVAIANQIGLEFSGSGGTIRFAYNSSGSEITVNGAAGTLNAWQHIAVVRNGSTLTIYKDGVSTGTATINVSITTNADALAIGVVSSNGSFPITGYITNFRIVKGTAVYTSNFTPPTAPLTAITNTSLLTLQTRQPVNNHTFIDGSENSLVVARGGNTSQGSFSPFSPAGWSNYFDGTGDYLTVADNAALTMGASSFTIEGWFYPLNYTGSDKAIIVHRPVTTARGLVFGFSQTTGTPFVLAGDSDNASWNLTLTGSTAATLNAWNHVAFTRNSSTWNLWLNGVSVASGTASFTLDDSSTLYLFAGADGSSTFPGYISNFRIIKGNALYTSNFTPPTTALTAVANTSLLTCQSNRFIDNSTNNFTITKNGDTKVVNFSPFAPTAAYSPETYGASAYFDGTGDYLTLASNVLPDISGVFTYECWIYPMDGASGLVFGTWNNNTAGWGLFVSNTTASFNGMSIFWYFGNYGSNESARGVNSNAMITNAWNHIAVVRNASNVWAFYVNGIERGTTTFGSGISWSESRNFTDGNPVGIGTSGYTPRQSYISDARLVIGNAVYTANFTPPTAPLIKIGGTNLLLNFNSGGIIDSTSRNVLECVGDAKIVTSIRKYGTGSMSFDGTGDYLQAPNSTIANFGSEDFTIEFWMYASSQALAPIVHQTSYASNLGWIIWNYDGVSTVTSTRKLSFMLNGGAFVLTTPSDAYTNNTWTHIAVVKNGTGSNNIKIYSNGSQIAAGTYSTALNNATQPLMVGGIINGVSWNSTNYYNGYLDDLRITKFARYTANFTPPTSTFLVQ